MIITIASGKGGTGKTTVATSLAQALSDERPVILDCDVEAPNAHLFVRPDFKLQREVTVLIPQVNEDRCSACGRCGEVCQFHAIVVMNGTVLIFPELCHGCGSCAYICPEKAILEMPRKVGVLEAGEGVSGVRLMRGVLDVGEPMPVPIIHGLLQWQVYPDREITIRDAPPGVSCPVVASMLGADFVLLVTEPTPFGLHDLRLASQLTRELHIPSGIVVNKVGVGNAGVEAFCHAEGLPILMHIPLDRRYGEAIAGGQDLVSAYPEFRPKFEDLYIRIQVIMNATMEDPVRTLAGDIQ